MANKIIKGLAIAAGTGLAIGLGNNRNRPQISANIAPPEDGPEITETSVLNERLDRVENRLGAVEARPQQSADTIFRAEIDARFNRQTRDITALRVEMAATQEKLAAAVTIVKSQFADVGTEIPATLASIIAPHVAGLRARLGAEIQESVEATLASFEQTLDNKVSLRIAILEKTLVDQSGIITALSQRAIESDMNLQRLISAVEKLCERTDPRAPAPATQQGDSSLSDVPFDKHLSDAIKRPPQSAPPTAPSGFRPSIVKEDEELRPRHRMARL
jgi:uncharacterized coiled-coil protein SlyX